MDRKKTRTVTVGNVKIGGNNPVTVQSMTKTFTHDIDATVRQIRSLQKEGCDMIRVAVPGKDDAKAIKLIKQRIKIPLVADIQFNHKLAVMAVENGADKIRINPGNIGGRDKIREIVAACRERAVPIRVGINSGSLEADLLRKYGHVSGIALVESALRNVKLLEDLGFEDIVISVKATSVVATIEAYRALSRKVDYPLHIGITESGFGRSGIIWSSVGIGSLLSEGIGDTLRVSLTGEPAEEVRTGIAILKSLELKRAGVRIISCPTCGRCQINIEKVVRELEKRTSHIKKAITVAVMGCAVNGPGEAKEADIGIACGRDQGLLFRKGKALKRVPEIRITDELMNEIMNMEGSNDR